MLPTTTITVIMALNQMLQALAEKVEKALSKHSDALIHLKGPGPARAGSLLAPPTVKAK